MYEEYDFEATGLLLLLLQMRVGLPLLVLLTLTLLALTPGTTGVTDTLAAVVREVEIVASDVIIQGENGVVEVMYETVMQEVHAPAVVNGTPGPTMDANIRSCKLRASLSYPSHSHDCSRNCKCSHGHKYHFHFHPVPTSTPKAKLKLR